MTSIYNFNAYNSVLNVQDRLEESQWAAEKVSIKVRENQIKFEQMLSVAQSIENDIFNFFNVRSIEELNSRVEAYSRQATVFFTGESFKKYVIEPARAAVENIYNQYAKKFMAAFNAAIAGAKKDLQNLTKEEARTILQQYVNFRLIGPDTNQTIDWGKIRPGGQVVVHDEDFNLGYDKNGKVIVTEIFGQKFSKGLRQRLNNKAYANLTDFEDGEVVVHGYTDKDTNYYYMLFQAAGGSGFETHTQFKEIWDKTDEKGKERIINIVREFFINYAKKATSGNLPPYFINTINDYVNEDTIADFFVGKSINDITGIFGELNALYFIHFLFGENKQISSSTIEWLGNQIEENKKPPVDIVVKGIMGEANVNFSLQVKNTSDSERGIFEIRELNQQMIEEGLRKLIGDETTYRRVMQIFFMKAFNIEFQQYKEKAVEKPNSYFRNLAGNEISSLSEKMSRLLIFLQPQILNLNVTKEYEKNNKLTNDLFLFGIKFVTAAQILKEIKDFSKSSPVGFNTAYQVMTERKFKDFNIVDFRNTRQKISIKKQTTKITSYYNLNS